MDEGSLGSTVDLRGSRPFDFGGFRAAASAQVGYGEMAEEFDPRVSALVSNTWNDGRVGALLSASYSKRNVFEEGYNPVRWEQGSSTGGCYSPPSPSPPPTPPTGSAASNTSAKPT